MPVCIGYMEINGYVRFKHRRLSIQVFTILIAKYLVLGRLRPHLVKVHAHFLLNNRSHTVPVCPVATSRASHR